MIVHRYDDGSEGYQPEIGDEVVINDTIHHTTIGRISLDQARDRGEQLVGKVARISRTGSSGGWRTSVVDVKYDPEWGPAPCFPWMLEPTPETRNTATIVMV